MVGVLGAVLGVVLITQSAQTTQTITSTTTLSPSTIIAVKTAPSTVDHPLGGEFTLMTLSEAQAQYDELAKVANPTQRQIQLIAALRIAIGTIEGNEACRLGLVPSCRVMPVGYRQPSP